MTDYELSIGIDTSLFIEAGRISVAGQIHVEDRGLLALLLVDNNRALPDRQTPAGIRRSYYRAESGRLVVDRSSQVYAPYRLSDDDGFRHAQNRPPMPLFAVQASFENDNTLSEPTELAVELYDRPRPFEQD